MPARFTGDLQLGGFCQVDPVQLENGVGEQRQSRRGGVFFFLHLLAYGKSLCVAHRRPVKWTLVTGVRRDSSAPETLENHVQSEESPGLDGGTSSFSG